MSKRRESRRRRGAAGGADVRVRAGTDATGAGRGVWVTAIGALAIWFVYLWYARSADGVYNDDDLGHYFMARDAWHDPLLFLNVWGRPLFTLLYSLPARWGFQAVQLTTTLVTVATVVLTARAGVRLLDRGTVAPTGAVAGGLLATMPFVLLLSTASLTEPLCALVVAVAVNAWLDGRAVRFGLLASLIPLARLELALLVGFWALLLLLRRRPVPALLCGAGIIGWALAAAVATGEPLWLWHHVVTGEQNLYGTSSFWHYPQALVYIIGPVAFLFLLVDLGDRLRRRRLDVLAGSLLVAMGIYVLLAWKLPFGHSAGFLRHLVAVTPLLALAAMRGMQVAWRTPGWWSAGTVAFGVLLIGLFMSRALVMHHRPVGPFEWSRLLIGLGVLGVVVLVRVSARSPRVRDGSHWIARVGPAALVVVAFGHALIAEPPLPASPEQLAVRRTYDWYAASPWAGSEIVATHPWLEFYLDEAGRRPPGGPPRVGREAVEAATPESVIFWDSHYSLRAADRMELADFKFDPRYEMRFESIVPDSSFVMYALVKQR